ncbi:transposase [Burkholderia vietnamiensis]|nr:transposase [Burkholderia vietnamiensis]
MEHGFCCRYSVRWATPSRSDHRRQLHTGTPGHRGPTKSEVQHVVEVLARITATRGYPATTKVDNGNEFISKVVDWCAYEPGIELDFRLPGTPTENVKVESFNGRFRQEGLNAHRLLSLAGAQQNK